MRVLYISPSSFPSRTANSIHVIRMSEAYSQLGHEVTTTGHYTGSEISKDLRKTLEDYYGANLKNVTFELVETSLHRGINILIAFKSFFVFLKLRNKVDLLISRNLYASFLVAIFVRLFAFTRLKLPKIYFETHQLEFGFKKRIQKFIVKAPLHTTIVISQKLKEILSSHLAVKTDTFCVFHDAAASGREKLKTEQKKILRERLLEELDDKGLESKWHIGYFGHLYQGRGIEVIIDLAQKFPEYSFWVFGGNQSDIERVKKSNCYDNVKIMGFVEPAKVFEIMQSMDILLMPYQEKVLIGSDAKRDTGQWMSPMKMFEYMSSGVPIISSDLPVLREVLRHEENAMLSHPSDVNSWQLNLQKLIKESSLAEKISNNAFHEYKEIYNWNSRAKALVQGDFDEH